jgi:putative copper export protein
MAGGTRKQRVVALVALTAILLFAYAAANHWHSTPTAEDHCQVCHVAHSLSVAVWCALLLPAPVTVVQRVLLSRADPALDLQDRHVSSRAPPAFQVS